MLHKPYRILITTICLLVLLSSVCLAERPRSFVDAVDHTGYYIYTDTIAWNSDHEVTADVAMIKANTNRMFVYRTKFDTAAATCQFLTSAVYRYDTKKLLMQSNEPLTVRPYTPTSPLKTVVDYLLNLKNSSTKIPGA